MLFSGGFSESTMVLKSPSGQVNSKGLSSEGTVMRNSLQIPEEVVFAITGLSVSLANGQGKKRATHPKEVLINLGAWLGRGK